MSLHQPSVVREEAIAAQHRTPLSGGWIDDLWGSFAAACERCDWRSTQRVEWADALRDLERHGPRCPNADKSLDTDDDAC